MIKMKNIVIIQKQIKIISEIIVDGKSFPIHQWNIDKANAYLQTKDEKYIKELKDFSLEF